MTMLGILLPLIVFIVWFWAIHTGSGFFKYSKDVERQRNANLELENAVEYLAIDNNWRDSFLRAVVLWGVFLAITSEILSLNKLLSKEGIFAAWATALLITLLISGKSGLYLMLVELWKTFRLQFSKRPHFQFSISTVFALILLGYVSITLVVAAIAPPNTNDSLQYHMSRVMHWFQDHSLVHYATPIDRQIWMPIWSETAILHFFALAGSDRMANLVQWFSMIVSLIGVSLIAARLGATRWGQLLAMLFMVTLPMGVLQSTSTQTDYVNACWAVIFVYFIVRIIRSRQFSYPDLLWAGGAAGLGVLTKGTFYVYAVPFLVMLAVFLWFKAGKAIFIKSLFSGLVVVILINAGVWVRNFTTYHSPLGPPGGLRSHANEVFGLRPLASNLIRNATLHLGTPYGVINGPIYDSVAWFHNLIGQDLNDPRTSMNEYWVKRSFQEDYAGNPWHFLSIFPVLFLVAFPTVHDLWRKFDRKFQEGLSALWFNRKQVLIYSFSVLSTFILFSLVYKWQRTGSRLQLPFFILWSPIFGVVFESLGKSRLARIVDSLIILIFVLGSQRVLLSNASRQLISWETQTSPLLENSRIDLLFDNFPEIEKAYLELSSIVQEQNCTSVGLMLDSSDAEYPFWAILAPSGSEVHFEHLRAVPDLSHYVQKDEQMCALICSMCADPVVEGMQRTESIAQYSLYLPVLNPR